MSEERFTPQRHHYDRLHERAQQLLRVGMLPRHDPVKTFAGRGSEFKCALCGTPVFEPDVEYELEFHEPLEHFGTSVIRFHLVCHQIWDYERSRMAL